MQLGLLHSNIGIAKVFVAHHLFETLVGWVCYHCLCFANLDSSLNFVLDETFIVVLFGFEHDKTVGLPEVNIQHPFA